MTMNVPIKQVKDLRILLKDLEPRVKSPEFLRKGREFNNFSLRPREALGNWLLCVVGRHQTGRDLTFGEDPKGGDGMIIDRGDPASNALTEHVFVPHLMDGDINQAIINAINSKSAKGSIYAGNRILVVFSEKVGMVLPSDLRRGIRESKVFKSIYLIALEKSADDGYIYWVTPLRTSSQYLTVHKVFIKPDFTDWRVELFEVIPNSYGFN